MGFNGHYKPTQLPLGTPKQQGPSTMNLDATKGIPHDSSYTLDFRRRFRATGEFRKPKRGEVFLVDDGANHLFVHVAIEALVDAYWIAEEESKFPVGH
jgi:hypothetical protein